MSDSDELDSSTNIWRQREASETIENLLPNPTRF